jgi:LppX_LprAFG lipoprotein
MLRARTTAIAAACAIAAVAAVTAGCGGSTGQALALDPVAAAATKTQDAGAARIRLALSVSSPQLPGKTVRVRAAGAIDGPSGELTFVTPGTLPLLGHTSLKEISLEQSGDYVVYVQLGALASYLPGGKQWVKLDVSKLGSSAGLDVTKLLGGSQLEPTDVLSLLKADGATIHQVGTATIDGATTTHYHVTVDLAKALQAKGLTSPLLAGMAAQLPKVPEDVWIGNDGLVRRVRVSYGLTRSGRSVHVAMTMNLSDYGAHVAIAAPPESEVFDATQLAQSGIGSALLH